MLNLRLLNTEQLEAVKTIEGPLLVLAGAGSGKTRVLTYRIANLIVNHDVAPWRILALTFTNKAAKEMKERTDKLLSNASGSDMWVTTFHSFCAKILRFDIDKLGFDKRFVIYDDQDQTSLITDLMKQHNIDDKQLSKGTIKAKISEAKNSSDSPEAYLSESNGSNGKLIDLYRAYQKRLRECNALDFDDLLLKTVEMLETCPDVLEKYQTKFEYVMVDEYQDTNLPQYKIIQLLCKRHRNICVVGDDDQSIYGWRGADIRNILEFEKDFAGAMVIRLEQNYRSTKPILDCANRVIANNHGRKPKRLWTDKRGGEPVELCLVDNEREEAYNIAKTIVSMHRSGEHGFNDFAVLYRTHAQSRVIESILSSGFGIPISIIGGTRFYSYKEVKDLLAYFKLIANPNDDVSFKRIINIPKRGIGDTTVAVIESTAAANDVSMFMAALTPDMLPAKISAKVRPFTELMREMFAKRYELSLDELAEYLIQALRYEEYLSEQRDGMLETRLENLHELIGAMREHNEQVVEGGDALQSFLENAALNSESDNIDESDGTVKLMTLHCAKGLEFPVVFLPAMENDVFPSSRSKQDPVKLEEERRLCYVGVTRAEQKLYLYAAKERMLYGTRQHNDPSIFLEEMELISPDMPMKRNSFGSSGGFENTSGNYRKSRYGNDSSFADRSANSSYGRTEASRSNNGNSVQNPNVSADVIDQIRKLNGISRSTESNQPVDRQESNPTFSVAGDNKFKKRQRVEHPRFGVGTIIDISGQGTTAIVTVNFDSVGKKSIAAGYVPMKIISE